MGLLSWLVALDVTWLPRDQSLGATIPTFVGYLPARVGCLVSQRPWLRHKKKGKKKKQNG